MNKKMISTIFEIKFIKKYVNKELYVILIEQTEREWDKIVSRCSVQDLLKESVCMCVELNRCGHFYMKR